MKTTPMKLMTFAEINDLENGQQIPALTGTVKKVFDQKSDVGQYGQWWLQSFILTDEHGVEIQCTWSCEDMVNELEGKTIMIEAGRDKKDQLAGVKKEIKNKGGKRYETVKLDDRCTIRKLNGDNQVKITEANGATTDKGIGSIAKEAWSETQRDPIPDPDWPEAEKADISTADAGIMEARRHLMRAANLYNLCIKCVDKMIAPNLPTVAQTSEQFQATLASLWIEASSRRSDDGIKWWSYIDRMPDKPLQ